MSAVGAPEIATALGMTRRGVQLRADREGWLFAERGVRGGRQRIYAVADLPKDVRAALMRRQLGDRPAAELVVAEPVQLQRESDLKDWQRDTMHARLALVREVDRLARDGGKMQAIEMIVADAIAGTLPDVLQRAAGRANARKGDDRTISVTSLRRWHDEHAEKGSAVAIAPRPSPRERPLPPAWMADFLDFYARPGKPSVAAAARALTRERPEVELPPLRSVQHAVSKIPAIERARGRMGPRAIRQLRAFVRRSTDGLWPTAIYSTDGHTRHRFVAHPLTGHAFRPEVTATIDVVTRKCVGWSAALAENTWGTIDALRHAFTTSGVCDIWYVDRGKGFNNAVFDDELTGLLARFDVEKQTSLPYRSQARGVIERFHKYWVELDRLSPAYAGEDMDPEARKAFDRRAKAEIATRGAASELQSWEEFLLECQRDVDAYNARPHADLGKKSPDQVWAEWMARGWRPDLVEPHETEAMFRPQERRQTRRGEIKLFNNRYFSIELEEFHELDVLVGYDIHDASRVWVSTLDQRLICEARFHGNSVSYFPVSHAQAAHERRVAGRLARVDKRREAVEAERQPPVLEFVRPAPAVIAPPLVEIVVAAVPPIAIANDERPRFADDVEMVAWVIARPERITPADAGYLLERIRGGTFRLRLEVEGVDLTALEALLKSRRSEAASS